MRLLTAVLIAVLTGAACSQDTSRGILRFGSSGVRECHEHIAEVVEIGTESHAPVKSCPTCIAITSANSAVAPKSPEVSLFVPPVFVAAEVVPNKSTSAAPSTSVEIIEATSAPRRIPEPFEVIPKSKDFSTAAISAPTAEQIQMMRELHLSVPPTILNADNSVRSSGGGSARGGSFVPTTSPYCPNCRQR